MSRTVAALEHRWVPASCSARPARCRSRRSAHRSSATPGGVLEEVAAIRRGPSRARGDLRIGYAWSALGRHTTAVQRRWTDAHPGSALEFVQFRTATAGLTDGTVDASVLRRPVSDARVRTALLGVERRYAAVAADDPLARRRTLGLEDFAGRIVAVDSLTGTTSEGLVPRRERRPARARSAASRTGSRSSPPVRPSACRRRPPPPSTAARVWSTGRSGRAAGRGMARLVGGQPTAGPRCAPPAPPCCPQPVSYRPTAVDMPEPHEARAEEAAGTTRPPAVAPASAPPRAPAT